MGRNFAAFGESQQIAVKREREWTREQQELVIPSELTPSIPSKPFSPVFCEPRQAVFPKSYVLIERRAAALIQPRLPRSRCPLRLREFAAADESIASAVQSISNARYLSVVDICDDVYVVDGSARDSQLIFDKGYRLFARNGAALWLLFERYDTRVPFAVQRNDHIRALGKLRRRVGGAAPDEHYGNESEEQEGARRRRNPPGDYSSHDVWNGRRVCGLRVY